MSEFAQFLRHPQLLIVKLCLTVITVLTAVSVHHLAPQDDEVVAVCVSVVTRCGAIMELG